jgi:hypothetical protein
VVRASRAFRYATVAPAVATSARMTATAKRSTPTPVGHVEQHQHITDDLKQEAERESPHTELGVHAVANAVHRIDRVPVPVAARELVDHAGGHEQALSQQHGPLMSSVRPTTNRSSTANKSAQHRDERGRKGTKGDQPPARVPATQAPGQREPPRSRSTTTIGPSPGRVAQRESARLTRERSLVRTQPRPPRGTPANTGVPPLSNTMLQAPSRGRGSAAGAKAIGGLAGTTRMQPGERLTLIQNTYATLSSSEWESWTWWTRP